VKFEHRRKRRVSTYDGGKLCAYYTDKKAQYPKAWVKIYKKQDEILPIRKNEISYYESDLFSVTYVKIAMKDMEKFTATEGWSNV